MSDENLTACNPGTGIPGRMSWSVISVILLVSCSAPVTTDVFIAGGGTGGVAAAIQASRMGVRTVIAGENEWLGGMLTSAGVSAVDGNHTLPGGIWGEFRDSLAVHYGNESNLKTGWVSNVMFEPSVGNRIFSEMAAAEPGLTVLRNVRVVHVKHRGAEWLITA
ncbi:MAG: FAD-dependent oxidoreductase [Bacteroidales bacterium]|nr:FAD-dependent oxidoreductase [Bacteroidales bacterium]